MKIMCLAVSLLCGSLTLAQPNPSPKTDSLWAAFDRLYQQQAWSVVGGGIAIVNGHDILYAQGVSYQERERNLPVTPNTVWGIGSCTKAFTATAIGKLVEQRKIDWDKPVRSYLTDFQLADEHATPAAHRS